MLTLLAPSVGIALLIAILAVLRRRLVFELQATSLLVFGTDRPGIAFYSLLMLPGTIIHELSHWLVAELLRVPTGKITIFPDSERINGQERLGSVATGVTDPLRGLLIGAAPFLVGTTILIVLANLLHSWWGVSPWWQLALVLYSMMVIGNSMLVSESDRHNWPIAIGFLLLLGISLWYLGIRPPETFVTTIYAPLLVILQVLGLTSALNLATIGACALLRIGAERISNKQIYRH